MECCKTWSYIGWSDSKFKCILKAHLPLNPERKDEILPEGCSDVEQRKSAPYQAQMTCPLPSGVGNDKLPLCSKKTRCCCRRSDWMEREVGQLTCLALSHNDYRELKRNG